MLGVLERAEVNEMLDVCPFVLYSELAYCYIVQLFQIHLALVGTTLAWFLLLTGLNGFLIIFIRFFLFCRLGFGNNGDFWVHSCHV